jgi:predicted glycogen debranching enzyme
MHYLHKDLYLSAEAERGLKEYNTDLLAGVFHGLLRPGETLSIVASTEAKPDLHERRAYPNRYRYEKELLSKGPQTDDKSIQQLVLSADQFVVERPLAKGAEGHSIIAGYPWFSDWGRDTMIALPGLTLETGRPELAAKILSTFAQFVDQGMLPNRFVDTDEKPEYNTVDATLWYFQAVGAYYAYTRDNDLLRTLFPTLQDIIEWHIRGTRHNIHIDPADHLLYAGEPGTQLTWMDAKCNDWVVTPRIGKPIEINALWCNALNLMADFAHILEQDEDAARYREEARLVGKSFGRFWNKETGYCFDVIDGPDGNDVSLRPNQLIAVSLPFSPLTKPQQKSVVDICEKELLTPFGLRSLARTGPNYIGRYTGPVEKRDAAYHQGTVWGWLIGPFVDAHLRVYGNNEQAMAFLGPLLHEHLQDYGLGSISEVFDGDEPFRAGGCPEQAWSVAELLRAWQKASSR